MTQPLISCLMVTRDRLEMFKRSVSLFLRQTWLRKELIVVIDGTDVAEEIHSYVMQLGKEEIKCVTVAGPSTLGRLRNISIGIATGEILCQWDDDDLYHPLRLERQFSQMENAFLMQTIETDYRISS